MAVKTRGSLIGVKFRRINNEKYCTHRDPSGQYCIHNGRFIRAFINGIEVNTINTSNLSNVDAVVFNHAGRCRSGRPEFDPIGVFHVTQVRVVPAFNYIYPDFQHPSQTVNIQSYCRDFRLGSAYYNVHRTDTDKILPMQPIAFCYLTSSGRRDVHNGRYLFWQDSALNRHCVLHLTDKPYRIWYSHMVFDANGNLTPQLRYRENILGFARIPLGV